MIFKMTTFNIILINAQSEIIAISLILSHIQCLKSFSALIEKLIQTASRSEHGMFKHTPQFWIFCITVLIVPYSQFSEAGITDTHLCSCDKKTRETY